MDLEVRPGEIVGLIGANGAGKSTLLDVISGQRRPSAGRIELEGDDVSSLGPEARPHRGLSRTFQDAHLYPGLTVIETVMAATDARAPRRCGVGDDRRARGRACTSATSGRGAEAVLAAFGLERSRRAPWSASSPPACGRCATSPPSSPPIPPSCCSTSRRPGSPSARSEALAPLLRDLRDRHGASVLVVEHDMPLLMSLCDRIYCLESGRVIAEGTPAEVRADPRVVASYLGSDLAAVDRSGPGRTKADKAKADKAKARADDAPGRRRCASGRVARRATTGASRPSRSSWRWACSWRRWPCVPTRIATAAVDSSGATVVGPGAAPVDGGPGSEAGPGPGPLAAGGAPGGSSGAAAAQPAEGPRRWGGARRREPRRPRIVASPTTR